MNTISALCQKYDKREVDYTIELEIDEEISFTFYTSDRRIRVKYMGEISRIFPFYLIRKETITIFPSKEIYEQNKEIQLISNKLETLGF